MALSLSSEPSRRLASARGLPATALGLGLRLPHYDEIRAADPLVAYVEVISENFLGAAPTPRQRLERVRARLPVVLHGVSLNLLGHAPIDERYLDSLARLADAIDAPFVTDHLCWTGAHGVSHHDLLPLPYTEDLVGFAAERAAHVQARLGRPFGLENLSSYVAFARSTLSEQEFYAAVVRSADCWSMLDVNNVYVSSQNHGFDPEAYLAGIDFSRVLQVHVAGHSREASGIVVDTHDQPVDDAVWALYRRAWEIGGPFPTLLERDANVPALPELTRELAHAAAVRA